jgi:hypothetical protein
MTTPPRLSVAFAMVRKRKSVCFSSHVGSTRTRLNPTGGDPQAIYLDWLALWLKCVNLSQ